MGKPDLSRIPNLNTLNTDSVLSRVDSTADPSAVSWSVCEQATVFALLIQEPKRTEQG